MRSWNSDLCAHKRFAQVAPPRNDIEIENKPSQWQQPLSFLASPPPSLAVSRWATFYTTPYTLKFLPSLSIAIPGVTINIPGLLGDIWESVLRAVPKNKVSHSKKRSRQMAGKALKDVNHLCKCPGCGEIKRTHRLCQHCLEGMSRDNRSAFRCNANLFSL